MSKSEKIGLTFIWIGVAGLLVAGTVLFWRWASTRSTVKYCTDWTRAVSIEPTNSDNGKYSDEQYIVKYEDGSITGQAQGDIPFARCTHIIKVDDAKAKPEWKPYNNYSGVEWED